MDGEIMTVLESSQVSKETFLILWTLQSLNEPMQRKILHGHILKAGLDIKKATNNKSSLPRLEIIAKICIEQHVGKYCRSRKVHTYIAEMQCKSNQLSPKNPRTGGHPF
jgi:hypothetical protein